MSRARGELTPLAAYELAERQRIRLGEAFRARLFRLHRDLSAAGSSAAVPRHLPERARQNWPGASSAFASFNGSDPIKFAAAYREILMLYGVRRIDPAARSFSRELREFHRNYVTNFPLPEEQESHKGFRDLWSAPPRDGGYEETAYSVACPLTGRYIMGVNFTIQPQSDSVHFIYGFVNPIARTLRGLSGRLIDLMRDVGRSTIAAHLARHPADRPAFHSTEGPLILFEKNIIDEMSMTDILMDTAHINIDRPPRRGARLGSSAIGQSIRDLIWDRRGGRIVDYNYMQSSLDGVVRVPDNTEQAVIACLNNVLPTGPSWQQANDTLAKCLGRRLPGCLALNLCAFVEPGRRSVPAAQIRRSNEIFQGFSVVKDVDHLAEDIYFQAQMASLSEHAWDGEVALKPILPSGPGVPGFEEAERTTKRLLRHLTWEELRKHRQRTYAEWLRHKAQAMAVA